MPICVACCALFVSVNGLIISNINKKGTLVVKVPFSVFASVLIYAIPSLRISWI